MNNINRIKQPAQCCIHCGKSYVKRCNLDRHIITCELLKKSKKSIISYEEEKEEIPSSYKMFEMLIELGKKYNKLEEKMEEMERWVVKKKKKINMTEWLNINKSPTIYFDQLIDHVIITDEDVEFLLNNSFYDSLHEVFSKTIYHLDENKNPIFAFIQKNNTFYIYDTIKEVNNNNNNNNNIWIELSREKLIQFLNKTHMKFIKTFYDWKKVRNEEVKKNDHFATVCDKTLVKLMSIEFKLDGPFNKARNMMYNHMKKDFKSIIEFEFEF